MKYKETLQYLYAQLPMFHRIGAAAYKANLDNTLELSRLLGQPESRFPSVHIAGTNGKGSTSHFLASILQEAGFKTGLFTSPHLRDFRERIRINGKMIPKLYVSSFVEKHHSSFETIQPSFFEWTFALCSQYFADEKVDIAIMETGMGGRLDSTNILHPVLTVITNISFDHMQFLGNTLEAIAKEKAGIMKKGIPVIIGETQAETREVFTKKAEETDSSIWFADQHFRVNSYHYTRHRKPLLRVQMEAGGNLPLPQVLSPLGGKYQLKNLLTVIQCVETLREKGYPLETRHVQQGIRKVISNTGFKGRWQILGKAPLIVADIGHNKDGILAILNQIETTPHKKLHFVIGVVNDKDIDSMLSMLPDNAEYYFCKADIPRGLDAALLKERAVAFNLKGRVFASVKEALDGARQAADADDMIVIGGSAFVVAEVV